jgi:glycosyltransferase involved in cell wall biosynthesis
MEKGNMKISIVVPLYNESELVIELYTKISSALVRDFKAFTHEIIFVDDGSGDTTFQKVMELKKKT